MGRFRDFELCPTKIEFPTLSATIALAKADGILAWYDQYVASGQKDPKAQLSGHLDFLAPNRSDVLFRITLTKMGIIKAQIQSSTANADQIKRVKYELYVSDMKLDGPGALGLE